MDGSTNIVWKRGNSICDNTIRGRREGHRQQKTRGSVTRSKSLLTVDHVSEEVRFGK